MGDRQDVELDVVGARYIRDYEKDYVKKVEEEIDGDPRIKLHPVTDDPASWYSRADVLLFLSVNEVTPLVIAEAGLHGLPSTTLRISAQEFSRFAEARSRLYRRLFFARK